MIPYGLKIEICVNTSKMIKVEVPNRIYPLDVLVVGVVLINKPRIVLFDEASVVGVVPQDILIVGMFFFPRFLPPLEVWSGDGVALPRLEDPSGEPVTGGFAFVEEEADEEEEEEDDPHFEVR